MIYQQQILTKLIKKSIDHHPFDHILKKHDEERTASKIRDKERTITGTRLTAPMVETAVAIDLCGSEDELQK